MAITTTTSVTETIYAKIITEALIDAMYSVQVMDALVRQESLVGKPSLTYSFPVWPALTAASASEGTDITSNTEVNTTNVDIAVSEGSTIRIDVTDLVLESSLIRDGVAFANQGGKAVADKRDADLAALLGGFSSVEGTSATAFSRTTMLAGMTTLHIADAPQPYVVVLHPRQVGHLRDELVSTGAATMTNRRESEFGPGTGFEFNYILDIFASTNVPTADAGASYTGAIFALREALGRVDKRPIRVEPQRDASFRLTEYIITSVYGQGELVDSWGVTLKSKSAA